MYGQNFHFNKTYNFQFSTWLVLNGIIGALFGGLTGVAEVNKRPEATVRSV